MKKVLFHLVNLGSLGYAVSMVTELSSIWRFALTIWVAIYSGIAIRHLHNWLLKPSPRALRSAAVSRPVTTTERRKHGATLVSEVRRDAFSEGAQPQVQDLRGADTEPELARAALGPGDSRDSAEAEAGLARVAAEAVGAGSGVRI